MDRAKGKEAEDQTVQRRITVAMSSMMMKTMMMAMVTLMMAVVMLIMLMMQTVWKRNKHALIYLSSFLLLLL